MLAELGALKRTIRISTKFLAEKLGVSQQTVSRYLIDLERIGWIKRVAKHDGSLIRLTDLGDSQLRTVRLALNSLYEEREPSSIIIEGKVFSGLGEGAYYVRHKRYREQFIKKLGFDPYPGTLNLRLTSEYDIQLRRELEMRDGIEIRGFKDENRTFGAGKCFHALIDGKERGAVVLAFRSHYDSSVIEVIAPKCLGRALKLKDGNRVKVEVFLRPR